MSYSIFTNSAIQNSNLTTKTLTNFLTVSSNKININGNLGIGTNILFQRFHIDNLTFNMNIKISNENKIRSTTYNTYYALLPIGSIIIFPTSSSTYYTRMVNQGWIECDGRTVSSTSYPLLEPLLRNSIYGNNGPYPQTSFNVPNFKDRIPIGAGGTILQSDVNVYERAMTINQLPRHKHNFNLPTGTIQNYSSSHTHTIDGGLNLQYTSTITNIYSIFGRRYIRAAGVQSGFINTQNVAGGNYLHSHRVMLSSGNNFNATPDAINLRHNVLYTIYMIKGR